MVTEEYKDYVVGLDARLREIVGYLNGVADACNRLGDDSARTTAAQLMAMLDACVRDAMAHLAELVVCTSEAARAANTDFPIPLEPILLTTGALRRAAMPFVDSLAPSYEEDATWSRHVSTIPVGLLTPPPMTPHLGLFDREMPTIPAPAPDAFVADMADEASEDDARGLLGMLDAFDTFDAFEGMDAAYEEPTSNVRMRVAAPAAPDDEREEAIVLPSLRAAAG